MERDCRSRMRMLRGRGRHDDCDGHWQASLFIPASIAATGVILAAGTCLFIATLWAVSIRSTRGAWQPAELTTAGYASLQVERLRRELERTFLGTVVTVLLSAFVLFVMYEGLVHSLAIRDVHVGRWDFAPFWIVGGVVNIFVVLAQMGRRRKAAAELAQMADIQRRLEPPPDEPAS